MDDPLGLFTSPPEASERARKDARRLLWEFCNNPGGLRYGPTVAELDELWAKCSAIPTDALTQAMQSQLSRVSVTGQTPRWWLQSRMLRALKHVYSKGEVGQTVAMMVAAQSKGLLEYAAREVPQCQEDSAQLLQCFSLSARR